MYSYDLKIRVVNAYIKFKSSRKVAKLFEVHHSTVCRWIKCITPKIRVEKIKSYQKVDKYVHLLIQQCPLMSLHDTLKTSRST